MQSKNVKIVVFVPISHADKIREVIAQAGPVIIGNYTHCTFSSRGVGRFLPDTGANPTIGTPEKYETVEEERIETICSRENMNNAIQAIKKAHPYEEVALDVYVLEDV